MRIMALQVIAPRDCGLFPSTRRHFCRCGRWGTGWREMLRSALLG